MNEPSPKVIPAMALLLRGPISGDDLHFLDTDAIEQLRGKFAAKAMMDLDGSPVSEVFDGILRAYKYNIYYPMRNAFLCGPVRDARAAASRYGAAAADRFPGRARRCRRLSEAVTWLLGDASLREWLSKTARAVEVDHFSLAMQACGDKVLYLELIESRARSGLR
jgi:hypothetical protein